MGGELPPNHGADKVPCLLLPPPSGHRAFLHPDGTTSRVEHEKHARGNAGNAKTGKTFINILDKVHAI